MISPRTVFLLHYKKFFLFIIVFVNIFHVYSSDGYQNQIDGHYDLIVIGGGSAGLSCAKEAAKHNKSVVVLDYVIPSPRGTSWGIGGTCVNAGCIPKKLYHHAANLKKEIRDSEFYGWNLNGDVQDIKNSWIKLRNSVQDYIKSVRWKIRRDLNNMNVKFIQGLGSFIDKNTVRAMVIKNYPKFAEDLDHKNETLRGNNILIAVGSRPFYPRIPTDLKNYCITSDDIFYLENPPGKTVVIGAGYIGLEFAGFLNGLGFPTTVIVRNNLLKDFDQQMVQLVKDDMEEEGVAFCIKCEVQSVKAVNYTTHYNPSGVSYVVRWLDKNNDKLYEDVFHTIICATGRKPTTNFLNLDQVGVNYDRTTGKILANNEETNVPHIYAAGDVLLGVPELTPSAIQAGQLLGKRLFGNGHQKMDYTNIPSTVFTPLEYGFVGLSEESAIVKYGLQSVEVYHGYYYPLEWEIPRAGSGGIDSKCYLKVITLRQDDKIIGIHFTGPHAGDVIQGFAVAMKNGLTVHGLQNSVGIHPTIAEEFTRLSITKRSGLNPKQLSCCS